MSTRATIRFKDQWDEYFVYRGHDGFPDNIIPAIEKIISLAKGRWSGSELGQLVSMFLGANYDENRRIQSYELTNSFHGDESYRYYVTWDDFKKSYTVSHE